MATVISSKIFAPSTKLQSHCIRLSVVPNTYNFIHLSASLQSVNYCENTWSMNIYQFTGKLYIYYLIFIPPANNGVICYILFMWTINLRIFFFNWINQPDAATSQVYYLSFKYTSTVMLVVVGPARPRPTALLSPSSDSKPEAATAVVVTPDDGHEDARSMLSCI